MVIMTDCFIPMLYNNICYYRQYGSVLTTMHDTKNGKVD